MKALIIAAGRGSRISDIAKDEPKPLIQLLGLSLIERIILTAKQAGITEFVIVIGYLGEKIKMRLGDGNKHGVKIKYVENEEWRKGNGVSVLKARELLNENFIIHFVESKKQIEERYPYPIDFTYQNLNTLAFIYFYDTAMGNNFGYIDFGSNPGICNKNCARI